MLKTGTIFSLRDKQLVEINDVEITRVDCCNACFLNSSEMLVSFVSLIIFNSKSYVCTRFQTRSI